MSGGRWKFAGAAIGAAVAYWTAFSTTIGGPAICLALPCLFYLANLRTARQAFYVGLVTGIVMYAPPLVFFLHVFGPAAIAFYLIAGLPIAVFVYLVHSVRRRYADWAALVLTPVLWTGIEFFRSELYQLRFAWLLPGQAFAFLPGVRFCAIGVYGLGFVLAAIAAMLVSRWPIARWAGAVAMLSIVAFAYWPAAAVETGESALHVAGVQLEFPGIDEAAAALDLLAIEHPEAQILVLSEYSFYGQVPEVVREVLRKHHRYLIAGGTRSRADGKYYDTAYVVGPNGTDLFEQAKSVPVQFLADGLPAEHRAVWQSPWGKIGIAVCYDLSYGRVMDDFVREGAAGLIIPTEDGRNWGLYERKYLHGRMAPIRSAEYGIPTFGVWSSGTSQLTDRFGNVIATAGYPGQGDVIAGPFNLQGSGRVPIDRLPAFAASIIAAVVLVTITAQSFLSKRAAGPSSAE